MLVLDLTLETPEANLALDEALLEWSEETDGPEILRFWRSPTHFVALGYGNHVQTETFSAYCQHHHIPILRRPSGGGAVLQGPESLSFALILNMDRTDLSGGVACANRCVIRRNSEALASIRPDLDIRVQGHSDITINTKKISGNAQRRKKFRLLFHGAFLMEPCWDLMSKTLQLPARKPDYRGDRDHQDFLTTLPISESDVKAALMQTWDCHKSLELPTQVSDWVNQLIETKYKSAAWNFKF
jgi:lipoate---protein ligase